MRQLQFLTSKKMGYSTVNVINMALSYGFKRNKFTGLIFENESFSNEDISIEAKRFAEGFRNLGIQSGEIVATILPNCKEILTVYEGVLRCGGVLLPIIFALTEPEITYMLTDSKAKYIITRQELLDKIHDSIFSQTTVIVTNANGDIGRNLIDW